MGLWTIIIDDGCGTEIAYKVRARDVWIARSHALSVFTAHNSTGQCAHILEGEVKFLPNYEGHEPIKVVDLGTAQFGDD